MCPDTFVYSPCGSPCPQTCDSISFPGSCKCDKKSQEGCFCRPEEVIGRKYLRSLGSTKRRSGAVACISVLIVVLADSNLQVRLITHIIAMSLAIISSLSGYCCQTFSTLVMCTTSQMLEYYEFGSVSQLSHNSTISRITKQICERLQI